MRLGVAFAVFWSVAAAAGVLLGVVFSGLGTAAAFAALAGGAAAGAWAWRATPPDPAVRLGWWDGLVLAVWTWACFRAFFWLLYPDGADWKILSPHNLGDLALHLNFIQYLASGVAFWPPSPILSGEPLTYPAGADLFNSLLLLAGVDVRAGLIAAGFGAAMLGGWVLWRYGRAFGVAALIFGGGLAGFAIFRTGEFVEYGAEGVWKNAFLTMVVPQRGFLFALPAVLILLQAWRAEIGGGKEVVPLPAQWVLYSALPLFQLHAFLFLSGALALRAVCDPRHWRRPVLLALAALPPASLAVLAVTGGFAVRGNLRWDPWWSLGEGGVTGFALEFGPALVLAVAAGLALRRRGTRADWWLYAVCAVFAVAAFLFPLTAWEWDNTKLLIWCWLAGAPLLWKAVIGPLHPPARAAICALLFFTGAVALAAGLDARHGYFLASRAEIADWRHLTRGLPPETVFAATPDYNHPLLLIGRRLVCGYEGHLSSHGLPYRERLAMLRRVLSREEGWPRLARALEADFLALRAAENPGGSALLVPVPDTPPVEHGRGTQ